ncbi:hypothetical protein FJ656_24315 [Schumannella luteola]|uniref:ABC-type phosphate transport system substrate-binding protein n=1 Tax=Schumannella luteola TaxID=472059 RepID=A0A852YBY6_9MICO|nr:substrate-binding domain-containing protein [Schumannella luteola]NYG98850.1 ABC-type phosphate transport system substrate-binding protein [Schumannella luteola]TPX02067.1 hypothetical protein FJ656_24315 [Schumannella luteola]
MKIKKIAAFAAVAAVAVAGSALVAPAFAEPVSNSYVLVGSDTLQDSANALINGTDISGSLVRVTTGNGATLGSFDAFGSPAVQTKPNGAFFGRPGGSGAGVTALRASITGVNYSATTSPNVKAVAITNQVDIARSSSAPGSNANADGKLLYYPFARDAVGYAYKGGNASWANLSAAQLRQIYDGTLTNVGGADIKPRLPQTASGTRSFFLGALGYTAVNSVYSAPAVNDNGNVTAENDATVLNAGEIIPFSVASWVAQANGVSGVNSTTGASLGSAVTGVVPVTGTAPALEANPTYYADAKFGRDTFLVVERSRVQQNFTGGRGNYDATLARLFDPTNPRSLINYGSTPNSAGAVKTAYGFLPTANTTPQPAFVTL